MNPEKEVSITKEGLSEIWKSESEEGRLSEVKDWGCACWRSNIENVLDVELLRKEDNVCICVDHRLKEWGNIWEEDVNVLFDESLVSLCKETSTEEVEYRLEDSSGYDIAAKKFHS